MSTDEPQRILTLQKGFQHPATGLEFWLHDLTVLRSTDAVFFRCSCGLSYSEISPQDWNQAITEVTVYAEMHIDGLLDDE